MYVMYRRFKSVMHSVKAYNFMTSNMTWDLLCFVVQRREVAVQGLRLQGLPD